MNLTTFTLFYNFPINDFQSTIHFNSNDERDNAFFKDRKWESIEFSKKFNFARDRLTVQFPLKLENVDGLNYASFKQDNDSIRYYCMIDHITYTDGMIEITFIIDVLMTWCQGNVISNYAYNVLIHRQHLSHGEYTARLEQLKNNGDIIKVNSLQYIKQKAHAWKDFIVIFQSSFNLESEFGSVDKPKMTTSSGVVYDKITGQTNLYAVDYNNFNKITKEIENYSWVAQTISNINLIPKDFISTDHLINSKLNNKDNSYLKKFKNGAISENHILNELSTSYQELYSIFNIDINKEPHLLRNGYVTIECYAYDGQQIIIDPSKLDYINGLIFKLINTVGYENKMAIYLINNHRRSGTEEPVGEFDNGQFLNNAIFFSNWTQLPILINNYQLSLASSANQRSLSESKLLTNRIQNILTPKTNDINQIESKFFDLASVIGGGISTLGSKFTDEYEFYRTQKAEFADLQLSTPSISEQNNGYNFLNSNNIFGINLKFSSPSPYEMNRIRKYYKTFGYEIEEITQPDIINSMSIMNYLKFEGTWNIPHVPIEQMQQIKLLLTNGVKFYHYNNTSNPLSQNLLNNERIR